MNFLLKEIDHAKVGHIDHVDYVTEPSSDIIAVMGVGHEKAILGFNETDESHAEVETWISQNLPGYKIESNSGDVCKPTLPRYSITGPGELFLSVHFPPTIFTEGINAAGEAEADAFTRQCVANALSETYGINIKTSGFAFFGLFKDTWRIIGGFAPSARHVNEDFKDAQPSGLHQSVVIRLFVDCNEIDYLKFSTGCPNAVCQLSGITMEYYAIPDLTTPTEEDPSINLQHLIPGVSPLGIGAAIVKIMKEEMGIYDGPIKP